MSLENETEAEVGGLFDELGADGGGSGLIIWLCLDRPLYSHYSPNNHFGRLDFCENYYAIY